MIFLLSVPWDVPSEQLFFGHDLHVSVFHFGQVLKDYDKSGMINWPNSRGETPLFLACLKKKPEAVEILIHAGADPSLTNTSTLPIHAAVANGDIRYVDIKYKIIYTASSS